MTDFVLPSIRATEHEMVALRRQIHARPELGFEEYQTSDIVAEKLTAWGYTVVRGLGSTGVVGTLKCGEGKKTLGLRADMDALPIVEASGLSYSSQHHGKMHACGHDGHTATLLAAAKYLAEARNFSGTLNLIFQPAEEGRGGAKQMLKDGLFERFPCDAIFAMHNMPGFPAGKFGFLAGPFMASADIVTIRIFGGGGHGAFPHKSVDPVVVCASLVMALQTIVARNIDPLEMAVVSVGAIIAGEAANVIPETAEMRLSVRALKPKVRKMLEQRITALAHAQADGYGARAEVNYQLITPALENHPHETAFARQVAHDWLGDAGLIDAMRPLSVSEDFAFMLEQCPGSYLIIGNGDASGYSPLHNAAYDFNDACLPLGATYWVKVVERFLI